MLKRWIYTGSTSFIVLVLLAVSPAQAVPVIHDIFFTPAGGVATNVGGFIVEDGLLVPDTTIDTGPLGGFLIQNFNVSFGSATWSNPSPAGPPFGDSTEIIQAFTDGTGSIVDMFVFMIDNCDGVSCLGAAATFSELGMLPGGGAAPGGTFMIASDPIEGTYTISVAPVAADEDEDGVEDAVDDCLGTPTGEIVDASGCSISQICPCDEFKNHGQYVSCTARAVEDFVQSGIITEVEADMIVETAAHTSCGKKSKKVKE